MDLGSHLGCGRVRNHRALWVVTVVALLSSVIVPAASPGSRALAVNGGASVDFVVASDDVACLDNGVMITAEGASPEEFTSFVKLNDVPDGWLVESSWSVIPDGNPAISLGTVLTPVANPAGFPTPANPYSDTVYFPEGTALGTFDYAVSLQLREPSGTVVGAPAVQQVSCPTGVVTTSATVVLGDPGQTPVVAAASPGPQPIDWQRCVDPEALPGEECGTLLVPRDHFADDPTAGTFFAISLNRIPAVGVSRGVLFTNPGGPGRGGFGFARLVSSFFEGTSLDDYDIIGMDPRGVGASLPAPECMLAPGLVGSLGNPLTPNWEAHFGDDVPVQAALNSSCSVATARYLGYLGTRQVAADMDWVRRSEDARRGNEKPLAYLGASYGSRLGEVYLQQFGDNAGPFVLTGAVDPASSFTSFNTERSGPADGPGIQTAPDRVLEQWFFEAAPPPTRDQFFAVIDALNFTPPEPPVVAPVVIDGEETFVSLLAFLLQVDALLRSEKLMVGGAEYIGGIFAAVVEGADVAIASPAEPEVGPTLPEIPDELVAGDVNALRATGTLPASLASPMAKLVDCIDLPGVPTDAAVMTSAAQTAVPPDPTGSPNYLGWRFLLGLSSCTGLAIGGDTSPDKVWPARSLRLGTPPFPVGTPAPLVIGSVADTATPYSWSEEMFGVLTEKGGGASLLTYEGVRHAAGVDWPPGGCVRDPIVTLFASDGLPAADTTCPFISAFDRLPPTGVQATAGNGAATIVWDPTPQSAQRFGGTVQGFRLEQRALPDGDWVLVDDNDDARLVNSAAIRADSCASVADDPEATTCTVTGLTNTTTYEFRVFTLPVFSGSQGIASVSSNAVTPGLSPTPPPAPGPTPPPVPGLTPRPEPVSPTGPAPQAVPVVAPRFTG